MTQQYKCPKCGHMCNGYTVEGKYVHYIHSCPKCGEDILDGNAYFVNQEEENPKFTHIYSTFDDLESGGIMVRIYDGRYQWGYYMRSWEDIPEYLYTALVKFNAENGTE